ncbi:MAG: hypothetical protein A2W91_20265 [Bacteroidetes bacterium GWF2_38_335]|nr:MAG: hypothetical protein A2W91_20265 [Bacteroidetes bacterium GWF2_38_335]OFY79504.1 MAG: hypothetical protein A2281_13820 [Bacteroidetes bacterium RIFOXYA12_FULL_38_20]HBS86557.1 hypothetical protein [Bacteroidales bacterium]
MDINKLQHILVYTDFTEVGDNAVKHAAEMARIFNKNLTILHVIDDNTNTLFKKNTEEKVEQKLEEIAASVRQGCPFEVKTMYEEGCACKIINGTSETIDAVMVVLGVHEKNMIQYITPKYALKKIAKSRIPYLLINKKVEVADLYSTVYLPLTYLKLSKEKSNWAGFFGRLNKSEIRVMIPASDDPGLSNNLIYTRKIFQKFNINHTETKLDCKVNNIDSQSYKYSMLNKKGMVVIMTTAKPSLLEKLLGTRELHFLNRHTSLPVLAIAPRNDLYVPCV